MYVPLIMAKVAFRVISGHDGATPISILRCFVFIQTSAGKNANKHGQPDQYLGSMQVDEDGSYIWESKTAPPNIIFNLNNRETTPPTS